MEEADNLEQTEAVIVELSQILQQFQMKINEQESQSILISQYASESLENVEGANANLKQAHEYQKGNGHLFSYIFLVMTVLLWIWEWMNTKTIYY